VQETSGTRLLITLVLNLIIPVIQVRLTRDHLAEMAVLPNPPNADLKRYLK
jgi:hypothetical protein